jgi:ribosomal protein S18 acetylase RimI-like enzyme
MSNLDLPEIRRLGEMNLATMLRHRASHAADGIVREADSVLCVAGGHPRPMPMMNAVFRTDSHAAADDVLAAGRSFFAADRTFVLWSSAHHDDDLDTLARDQHLEPAGELVGMAIEPLLAAPPPLPADVELIPISTTRDIETFVDVVAGSFSPGELPDHWHAMLGDPAVVLSPEITALITTVDGKPSACAMSLIDGDVVGLYLIGTLPWARSRGLGATVTDAITRMALERGARLAVLQASPMGEPLYRRLGWREVTRYRRYLVPARDAI